MFVDKFKLDNGRYYYDECSYENETDLILSGFFKFCGCGLPEKALRYIKDVMIHIQQLQEYHLSKSPGDEFADFYSGWELRGETLYGNEGAKYVIWYVLDNTGMTEHGASVPGWLTPLGEDILQDIKDIINED